jgi:hypothetical protein
MIDPFVLGDYALEDEYAIRHIGIFIMEAETLVL